MSYTYVPRAALIARLESELTKVREGRGHILAVRGRRQMGKSTAVEGFVESIDAPYVYATGLFRQPVREQLHSASIALYESARPLPAIPEHTDHAAASWREWFSWIAVAATEGPIVVVLDEFPWMNGAEESGALEGVLQSIWDRTLSKLPVLLILIGSDVAMMEQLARHDRPLYGRLEQMVVPPLNPAEVARATGADAVEAFDAFLLTGGYPRLLASLVGAGTRASEWARASLQDPLSPFAVTAQLTLDAELTDRGASYRVLSTLGSSERGQLNMGTIASQIEMDGQSQTAALTRAQRTLTDLIEKGLVRIDEPAWATSTRLRRYAVDDTYLRAWFRYVEKHIGAIARGRGDLAVAAFDRDWDAFRGVLVEPIVRRSLLRLAAIDARLAGTEDVRPWWTRDGQTEVDAVGIGADASTFIGTIKCRSQSGITERDLRALSAAAVPRSVDAPLLAVSQRGEAPGHALAFSAADLLAAWE